MPDKTAIINHTQTWLSTVVIAHNLCPFAKREYDMDRIQYEVIDAEDLETQLEALILQCAKLDKTKTIETSLLIFPSGVADFDNYLNLLELATALLIAQGYEGVYQLASFHPEYCFEGVSVNDPSHYTNRSPYPMLHILREASVERVLKTYPNPEKIPQRNIELLRELGGPVAKALLQKCHET